MGYQSAILRGHRSYAAEILDRFHDDEFPSVVLGKVDEVEVRQLAAIVLKLDRDATLALIAAEGATIAEASVDGPWLADLPPGMDRALAQLTAKDIAQVAKAWAPKLDYAELVDADEIVSALVRLARGRQQGEALLFWMSI
jgi:hypothetical protein